MPAPSHLASHLWLPLGAALAESLVALRVLHGAVGRAMRARGDARWRFADTLLVSPLLGLGLLVFFAALNHGMVRYAADMERGQGGVFHLGGTIAVAVVALVVAWFGGRAVGKLY